MKKVSAVIIALSILCFSGCNTDKVSETSDNSSQSQSISDTNSSQTSQSKPESSVPEIPKGEPTFLTCPDGTVIYTSQITKYQGSARNEDGSHEQFPLDTFNMETFTDVSGREVVCDGFAYGFIPRFTINVSEAPEKFTEIAGVQMYSGEELPPSSEYFKIKTGDKFGSLTVKSAQSVFSNSKAYFMSDEAKKIPGVYLTGATIEYEGEIEMTGCIQVMETEGYSSTGDLWFYPDGNSVSKLPVIQYNFDKDMGLYHYALSHFGAYGELNEITLGNMFDYDIDFDGLEPGDDFVRVKITIKNPVVTNGYADGEPVAVEVLR